APCGPSERDGIHRNADNHLGIAAGSDAGCHQAAAQRLRCVSEQPGNEYFFQQCFVHLWTPNEISSFNTRRSTFQTPTATMTMSGTLSGSNKRPAICAT